MHSVKFRERNLVGQSVTDAHPKSLLKRYFRIAKHKQPGRVIKVMLSVVAAVELSIGRVAYA